MSTVERLNMALDYRSEMFDLQGNRYCFARRCLRVFVLCLCTVYHSTSINLTSFGQLPDTGMSPRLNKSVEGPTNTEVSQRFEKILRARPQEGTALDQFYDAMLQQGNLNSYCDTLSMEASVKKDASLHQLLGLIRLKQDLDAEAILALENAKMLRTNDPTTHLYLARAYCSTGNQSAAYESLRAALSLRPQTSLIPKLIQLLVRVDRLAEGHQRLAEIGGIIESDFGSNADVLRRLSDGYLQCSAPELAKPLLQKLIATAKSPQDEIDLRVQLADIQSKLGEVAESIAELQQLLPRVKPDSWLSDSIVQNIERLIEKQGGPDAVIGYYRNRLEVVRKGSVGNGKSSPNGDVLQPMLRLATLLVQSKRFDEAFNVVRDARMIAPSDARPLLVEEEIQNASRDFLGAAATMKNLVELDENNVDYRVRWGRYVSMISDDPKRRQDEAAAIWTRLMMGRENDPTMAVRIAELMHGISRSDDAIHYFQTAVRLSGNTAQYREYLGEYLFRLGRHDQALTTLQNLPEKERDGPGYLRLSEVLSQMHFKSEALQAMLESVNVNPTFETLIRYAGMLRAEERFPEALERLDEAEKLAMRTTDFAKVWAQQLAVLPQAGSLAERITSIVKKFSLETDKDALTGYQVRLAQLYQASGKLDSAVESANTAIQGSPESAFAWLAASMVYRSANLPVQELQSLDNLCRLDATNRLEYLQRMAVLNMQLRNPDQALAIGELLLKEPGTTPQHLKFFVALSGEARQRGQALEIARRYVDRNPRDAYGRLILAKMHMDNGEIKRAIDDAWAVLERATAEDLAQETVQLLIRAYRGRDQLTELPDLLRRFGLEHERQRDAAYWIAFAQHELGDSSSAWQSLERTLARNKNDIELVKLALKVATASGKKQNAVECQRQLNQLEPTVAGQLKLGELLFEAGDDAAASHEWRNAVLQRGNEVVAHRFARELINSQRLRNATAFLTLATEVSPDNWELAALTIVAHQQAGNPDRAVQFADRILGMRNAFDQSATALDNEDNFMSMDVAIAGNATLKQSSNIESHRLAWLERADQWQPMFNSPDLFRSAIRSQESMATVAQRNAIHRLAVQRGAGVQSNKPPSLYLPTFGDAHALAVLAKYGRINLDRVTERSLRKAFLKGCSESKDVSQLWDVVLLLQPTAFGASEENSEDHLLYRKCLDELVALLDDQAIQLATNDVVLTRSMQCQMSVRRMQSVPKMLPTELARLEDLLNLSYQRKQKPNLFANVQFAKELELVGRGQDANRVLSRGLTSSQDLDEVARCSQELIPGDVATAKRVLLQGYEIHRHDLLSRPSVDHSTTLKAIFDDAWRRDTHELGKNTNDFLLFLAKLMAIHGDAIDNSNPRLLGWDTNYKMENSLQLMEGKQPLLSADFVRPSSILPITFLMTFRHIFEVTQKQQLSAGLLPIFEANWHDTNQSTTHGRTLVQWASMSAWHWWCQNPHGAISAVQEARKVGVAVEFFQLWESQLLIHTDHAQSAIALLEQTQPTNDVMAVDRNLLLLQAAMKTGNSELVRNTTAQLSNKPMTTYQSEWFRQLNATSGLRP